MNKKKDNKIKMGGVIIVIAILVISSLIVSYALIIDEEEKDGDKGEVFKIDDRISPYKNQGIFIEILRIRNRGLLEKMMTQGTSWKNSPSYYYILNVDGSEGSSEGSLGTDGIYTDWDSFGQESMIDFFIPEEQEFSNVEIKIMEYKTSGFIRKTTTSVEKENIKVTYDYRTGRWNGKDDSFMDSDGYGHFVGEEYEVWFNIYQSDYDHDGIPYWTEVNVLKTDPAVDDSKEYQDPDNDCIPTAWEWRWGYDPFTWDDHRNLDPDVDGIENIEEYQMRKRLADPYQPDVYIEADGMEKKGLIDVPHIFYKESQQMVIERLCQHGINCYIDDGNWPDSPVNGGGEMMPFHVYLDDVMGKQMMKFYEHNFPDERKGIFRYLLAGFKYGGFITTCNYNMFDAMHIGNSIYDTLFIRKAYTPRTIRLVFASATLHELGHSFGLMPVTFPGNDIIGGERVRYPSMPEEEYEQYREQYYSIMNYKYTYDQNLFDFSDGSNGPPYDQNDWDYLYLPTFQLDSIVYEEPVDETFEDFEQTDEFDGILIQGWKEDKKLTEKYKESFSDLAYVKHTDCNISIYVKEDKENNDEYNIKVFAKPEVSATHALWSLVAEGRLESKNNIQIYSQMDLVNDVRSQL